MSRILVILPIALSLSVLTGCHDFTGQRVELGFVSNLHLNSSKKWTPEHAIAAGSEAQFKVSGVIDSKDNPEEFQFAPSTKGRLRIIEIGENILRITGKKGTRGTVQFRGRDKYDFFGVRFARPEGVELSDPLDEFFDVESDSFAIVRGSQAEIQLQLTDVKGKILGFVPDDLTVEAWGGLSASTGDLAELRVVADDASSTGEVFIQHQGRPIEEITIPLIDEDEIYEVELLSRLIESDDGEDLVGILAVAWLEDDTRALGVDVDWTWTRGVVEGEEEQRSDLLVLGVDELPLEVEATINGQTWTTIVE